MIQIPHGFKVFLFTFRLVARGAWCRHLSVECNKFLFDLCSPLFQGATLYLGFIAAQNFVYNEMPTHFDFGPSKHHGILYYIISAPEKGGEEQRQHCSIMIRAVTGSTKEVKDLP